MLTAERAFVCLTLFDIIRMPLAMLPLLIVYAIEVKYIFIQQCAPIEGDSKCVCINTSAQFSSLFPPLKILDFRFDAFLFNFTYGDTVLSIYSSLLLFHYHQF